MTTYYCVVFVDRAIPEARHAKHGFICKDGQMPSGYAVYEDLMLARTMVDTWNFTSIGWQGCYEVWEFDIDEDGT